MEALLNEMITSDTSTPEAPSWRAPDSLDKRFGARLRTLRIGKGIHQGDFGESAGRSRAYISDLENGKKSPTLKTVGLLAAALDMTMSDLLSGL